MRLPFQNPHVIPHTVLSDTETYVEMQLTREHSWRAVSQLIQYFKRLEDYQIRGKASAEDFLTTSLKQKLPLKIEFKKQFSWPCTAFENVLEWGTPEG